MTAPLSATIDGRPVLQSGTLVVPPGRKGALQIDGVSYTLNFSRSPGPPAFNSSLGLTGNALNFTNVDNPLGTHMDVTGFVVGGLPVKLSLVIYSIGDTAPARVLHYSMYSV